MRKLKTMQHAAKFRRKIIFKEWEHQVLKLTVSDMQEFKRSIQKSKITKEVQLWLKQKINGWSDDISDNALEREINAEIKSFERMLNEE